MEKNDLLRVVRKALWGNETAEADREIYEEMTAHAISALAAPVLSELNLPGELFAEWKQKILQQVIHYYAYVNAQHTLPLTVPYVILKGTTAAQYYPHPEYRSMGDIDVITRHEDFESACQQLLANGYVEETNQISRERKRHRGFFKNGFSVEVHLFFASMNDPVKAERFENYIIRNIHENHELPHPVNGLVLLEHINQHLEEGLGLRQIIDWMMFVNRELPDEKWPEFRQMAVDTGLEKLAVTVTRMCEKDLGLAEHDWCRGADDRLCRELMAYVLACGNFGHKRSEEEKTARGRAAKVRHPIASIRELQKMGIRNWEKAGNPFLRPWAWLWQGLRLAGATNGLFERFGENKRLCRMLDELEVRRIDKGLVCFEDGEYITKHL